VKAQLRTLTLIHCIYCLIIILYKYYIAHLKLTANKMFQNNALMMIPVRTVRIMGRWSPTKPAACPRGRPVYTASRGRLFALRYIGTNACFPRPARADEIGAPPLRSYRPTTDIERSNQNIIRKITRRYIYYILTEITTRAYHYGIRLKPQKVRRYTILYY